jgi:hypothetical protein
MLRPDIAAVSYPERGLEFEPKILERLKADKDLTRGWDERWAIDLGPAVNEWLWGEPDDWYSPEAKAKRHTALERVIQIIAEIGEQYGPPDILPRVRALFVFRSAMDGMRWIAPEDRAEIASHLALEPVELLANAGVTRVEVSIPPGSFAMIFAGASGEDRNAYTSLIQGAQVTLGYQNNGGRPRRTSASPISDRTDPRVVARLRQQGHSFDHIATILAAIFPRDGWEAPPGHNRESLIQRARRYAEDGDSLIEGNNEVS